MGRYVVAGLFLASCFFTGLMLTMLKKQPQYVSSISKSLAEEFRVHSTATLGLEMLGLFEKESVEVLDFQPQPGSTTQKITIPVVWSYSIDLKSIWSFQLSDQNLLVTAPFPTKTIKTIDFSKALSSSGSKVPPQPIAAKMLNDHLKQQIEESLKTRSEVPLDEQANLELFLVKGKSTTQDFVLSWLKEKFPNDLKKLSVSVQFKNHSSAKE